MPRKDLHLSVIIPAYNEAARLPATLKRLSAYLATRPFSHEILFVLAIITSETFPPITRPSCTLWDGRKMFTGLGRSS